MKLWITLAILVVIGAEECFGNKPDLERQRRDVDVKQGERDEFHKLLKQSFSDLHPHKSVFGSRECGRRPPNANYRDTMVGQILKLDLEQCYVEYCAMQEQHRMRTFTDVACRRLRRGIKHLLRRIRSRNAHVNSNIFHHNLLW